MCDTIDNDTSRLETTSLFDVSISDIQEFKPNPLAGSLNAKAFKPFVPTSKPPVPPAQPAAAAAASSALGGAGLDSIELNNDFTPSTPYVHKFRTEMCKNFELYGKCKYGDEVSILKFP